MRTDPEPRSAIRQAREVLGQARRRFLALGPRARWLAAGLLLSGLAAAGYVLAVSEPESYEWLFEGQAFPRGEVARALVALKTAEIPCLESGGRVGVPEDRRSEAMEVLGEAKVGPRPLEELLDEAAEPGSLLMDPREKAQRERRYKERVAETAIRRGIRGVVSAWVMLNPIETGPALRPQRKWRALVLVQTETDARLSSKAVQSIRHTLEGVEPGLEPNGLTLQDLRTGADYSVAGHPDVEVQSSVKVREEELREKILEQVGIEGARVLVRIDAPRAREPESKPAEEPGPLVNQPIVPAEAVEEPEPELRTTILVRVPRSYYLRLYEAAHPKGEASAEELRPIVSRTQEMIETVVEAALPAGSLHDLKIDRIDDLVPAKPTAPVAESELTRWFFQAWWLPGVAAGVATALVLSVGSRLVAGRWTGSRKAGGEGSRLKFEAGDAAGPSERVRELVRRDADTAAGVLHRWIAQGGGTE